MATIADSAVGAILEIPQATLDKIEKAERAIKSLQDTSEKAATEVSKHWGTTALTGLDTFIKKVDEASDKIGSIKMPQLDSASISSEISAIAQSMSKITGDSLKGGRNLEKLSERLEKISKNAPNMDFFNKIAAGIDKIDNTSQTTVNNVSILAQSMAQLASSYRTVQNAQRAASDEPRVSQINALYNERIRIIKEAENIRARGESAQKQGLSLTQQELDMVSLLRARYQNLTTQIEALRAKQTTKTADAFARGDLATSRAEITAVEKRKQVVGKVEDEITKKIERENAQRVRDTQQAGKSMLDAFSSLQKVLLSTPQGAINYAKNAKSLRELQDAYKNLKAVMSTVDPKSSVWQQMNAVLGQTKTQIDNIRTKMGELQSQSKRTGDVLSQLKGQLGAAFSIAAITGYIKKMVDVRAQFELQNVALRAILQNKDEADRIFMQVQQLALQSPFTIMQLTTYTKQLAAYRIEADKLVGTTKMLADVSAGLGVSMDRLILAYGQVKSANYLRATEVRQFTEAGLNIAGELANYFSELQGKMISVGDVMEMITKRMVRFEDVEEVFKRVTSAGGLFYDMQKKQAETLSGQLQRIQDAYSIMLNDIGKSNQGDISTVLTWIRQLISSWREVLAAVKSAAAGFAAYMFVLKLFKLTGAGAFKELIVGAKLLIADMKTATFWTNALKTAWRGVMSATGIGIIVAALTTWLSYLWETREAVSALNEDLGRIGSESLDEMNNSIGRFIELAKVVSDTSKTYTEHKEAIEELKRSYSEILPEQKLQSDYIRALNGDYKDLTDTIAQYYQAQEYQKKVEVIMSGDTFKSFSDEMKEAGNRMLENGMFDPYVTKSQVDAWVEVITKEIASGKLESSTRAIGERMQEIFGDALNGDTRRVGGYFTDAVEEANKLAGAIEELSIVTVAAKKNYQEGLGQALSGVSDKRIAETISDVANEIAAAQERIAKNKALLADPKTLENPQAWVAIKQAIDDDTIAIERNTEKLREHNAVLAEREGQKVAEYIEEGTNKITEQVTAYYNLNKRMHELKASGKLTADTERELSKEMNEAFNSANSLAEALGFKLSKKALDAMDSEYALGEETKSIAQRAFPALAQKAIEAMDDVQKALLRGELGFAKFKDAINSMTNKLGFKVFDDQTKTIEQLNQQIEALAKGTASASSDIDEAAKEAQSVRDTIAKKYGIRASDLDIKRGADENLRMHASSIRKQGEEAIKAYNDYLAAVEKGQKAIDGKINGYTKEEIELTKKKGDALLEYADQVYTEAEKERKSGAKGKDPMLKTWEDRLDALKRYYDAADKARKQLNVVETEGQQRESFENLWKSLGMDKLKGLSLNDLIEKGFDPKKLQDDYVGALEQLLALIPKEERFKDIRNKIQETISSESIEIDFKIKEDARNELKKDLDNLFANMELTKEFKKLGVPIDLTYMLGGKPVNIKDVQDELASLKERMGGEGAATEDIKLIEDYEKKVTQIIAKEQEERLKSYQKYLAIMYSDRAKKMISAYTDMKNIETDFYSYIATLEKEAANPATSDERRKQIATQITTLKEQAGEAIKSVRNQLDADLNKFEWEQFKGSEVFTTLYQDMQNMSKAGIDSLITKLTEMRNRLQSMEDIDYRAVRELTQYIEKLSAARVDLSSWKELTALEKQAYDLRKDGITMESAQAALMTAESELAKYSAEVDSITAIINLKHQEGNEINKTKDLSEEELKLYNLSEDSLKAKLKTAQDNVKAQQAAVDAEKKNVDTIQNSQAALKRKIAIVNELKDDFDKVFDSVVSVADALGVDTDIWGDFSKAIGDTIFSVITLQAQFKLMGIAANSALGVIGWIATALQVVANLLVAIFAAHDKKLEKQIKNNQANVDKLKRSFDKLKESVDNAFKGDALKRDSELALKNLEEQKKATEEMIRLEEAKKKTDKEQIKKYKEELEDLDAQIQELHETVIEKWGGFGSQANFSSASESFATAWLDSYKTVGDGLDALEEQWEEYLDNLLSKQIMLRVMGPRIENMLKLVDSYVSKGSEEDEFLTRNELDAIKNLKDNLFASINEQAKDLMEALGVSPGGEFILSDLQKGIQNITEPQAAAIEAYLNSMRFAVFRHTEQLDILIASVQAQYGSGAENPIVTELKGIRSVLDSIDRRLGSVIENRVGRGGAAIKIMG